ncbi:MAG: hypothetical protein ACRDQZ_22070 [Mycobacteriales bacterium]
MPTVLDLPRIPLARTPHLITLETTPHLGSSRRTHVAAVWGDLRSASSVIVQPMSTSATADEQTWRSCAVKTNSLAAALAPGTALVQWLGRTLPSTAELGRYRPTDADPIDRDAGNLVEFDNALKLRLPQGTERTYLGFGIAGYLIAEACKRGLTPSALAFVDTPGLGRQARRALDGSPVIVDGTLLHSRDLITCVRELNPNIADIPVLVVGDGKLDNEAAYGSPPGSLTDVIVATTRGDETFELLPRNASPAALRKYVFAAQQRHKASSAEAQRNLHAFLNGELHQIKATGRRAGGQIPVRPGGHMLRLPTTPLTGRDHTGDDAPRHNTRPVTSRRGSRSRPPGKPDSYHSRSTAG